MAYPLGTVVQDDGNGKWVETIITTGTWTAPTLASQGFTASNLSVEVIAGGGKSATSGGLDTTGASGAGGGAYSKLNSFSATPGTNYTATVGAGASVANTAGGDSWFSTTGIVLAKGGSPGAANGGAVGAGGATATGVGDVKNRGGNGGVGGLAAGGGGGGGAGSGGNGGDASGTTAGTGTATGGGAGGGSQTVGNVQGGGGGGGNGLGNISANGARGYVVLTYNRDYSKTITETVGVATVIGGSGGGSNYNRTQTETNPTAPATVANTRTYNANRTITETTNTQPADISVSRVVAFNRTQTETTPTQPATVTNTRGGSAFNRTQTHTTPTQPADVTNTRTAQFNRTQTIDLTSGGGATTVNVFPIFD